MWFQNNPIDIPIRQRQSDMKESLQSLCSSINRDNTKANVQGSTSFLPTIGQPPKTANEHIGLILITCHHPNNHQSHQIYKRCTKFWAKLNALANLPIDTLCGGLIWLMDDLCIMLGTLCCNVCILCMLTPASGRILYFY